MKENTICQCGAEKAWDEDLCPACQKDMDGMQERKAVEIVKEKTQEVQTLEQSRSLSPAEMIMQTVQAGGDISQLKDLLAIQKDWEANEARKAYHVAMANFKKEPIKIDKDKHVDFSTSKGRVMYDHASLANIVDKVTAKLSDYGLSVSWNTKQNGQIVVTCRITHSLGHTEETALQANAETSGTKNDIQAMGSTISYLQRYTLMSALGLAAFDNDNDGQGNVEIINDKELGTIRDYLIALDTSEKKFCEFMKIDDLEKMPKTSYQKAISALLAKMQVKGMKK